jgi:CRP/FNR family transcriptional regulator
VETGASSEYLHLFEAGETIFSEGDRGEHLYVIRRGEVELCRASTEGEQPIARLGAGDFFGELGVVTGESFPMRAVAVKKTTLLRLDQDTLVAMCLDEPKIGVRLIRVLASRLIEAQRRLWSLTADFSLRPVVRALLRHAEPASDGKGIQISLNLEGLAAEAGLPMQTAYRALHLLIDRKLVKLIDGCIHTFDLEALSAAVDAPE